MRRPVILELMKSLRFAEPKRYMESIFFCFAAPTIMGLKAGSLLNLRREGEDLASLWEKLGGTWLDSLGLEATVCPGVEGEARDGILLLVYRRPMLEEMLKSPETRDILRPLGYPCSWDLDACLAHLRDRFLEGFPHEIGLFLDYPPEDVRGFILNRGAGSLDVGYWKVYGDVGRARRAFRSFRRAEDRAARSLLNGFALPVRPLSPAENR